MPGFLLTETTNSDSGSMRHIAYTRLQASWARSLRPNWRRIAPEPRPTSLLVGPRYVKRASTACGVAAATKARILGTLTERRDPFSSSSAPSVTHSLARGTGTMRTGDVGFGQPRLKSVAAITKMKKHTRIWTFMGVSPPLDIRLPYPGRYACLSTLSWPCSISQVSDSQTPFSEL